MPKVLYLKNTKKGLVVDTVYNTTDTIVLNQTSTVQLADTPIEVKVVQQPKDTIDLIAPWAGILGGLAAFVGAFIAFVQLFKRDTSKQNQIDELKNQTTQLLENNRLFEKRIRMSVKPQLHSNSCMSGPEGSISITLNNRGELAFIDSFELIESEDQVRIQNWNRIVDVPKDKSIKIHADVIGKHGNQAIFTFLIKFHDVENYKYESIVQYDKGSSTFIETKEL